MFPDNIVEMAFREYETVLVPRYKYNITFANGTSIIKKDKGKYQSNCELLFELVSQLFNESKKILNHDLIWLNRAYLNSEARVILFEKNLH